MRLSTVLKVAVVAIPFALSSCKSKKAVETRPVISAEQAQKQGEFLNKVTSNAQTGKFITSKIKFSVKVGVQEMALTGSLKMKRNDVIRLQLMAFGFVEAARIEFTPEYILILDKINKQYMKSTYQQVSFLRSSGLNFYSLQSLFWNELFQPGRPDLNDEAMRAYTTTPEGNDVIIELEKNKLSYKWLASGDVGQIKMANILYNDKLKGRNQLNWDYSDFEAKKGKTAFPTRHTIMFTTPDSGIELSMKLNYLDKEDNWETRTQVSSKYREVLLDEMLRRFMAL